MTLAQHRNLLKDIQEKIHYWHCWRNGIYKTNWSIAGILILMEWSISSFLFLGMKNTCKGKRKHYYCFKEVTSSSKYQNQTNLWGLGCRKKDSFAIKCAGLGCASEWKTLRLDFESISKKKIPNFQSLSIFVQKNKFCNNFSLLLTCVSLM